MEIKHNKSQVEKYDNYLWIGIIFILLWVLGLSIYWLRDSTRLAQAAEELQSERIARGEEIYDKQCAACHGEAGEGGAGPALNDKSLLRNTLNEVFFSIIRSGIPNTQMPAWSVDFGGPLTDEDIRDTVAFMRAWEPTAPEISIEGEPPDPRRGALLFATTCAVCHGENGLGGQEDIPAINDPERLQKLDDAWYRGVIANGRPAKGMPTWGTVLSPQQLDDLVALIAAWRKEETIRPPFSDTTLIDRAYFAITQEDVDSAKLQLQRILEITTGPSAEMIRNVLAQLNAGDLLGAQETMEELQVQWPIGDPGSGALIYSSNCSVCHGLQGEGGIGTPLLNNQFIQAQRNSQLLQFLKEGRPGTAMAGFENRLSETEIANLIAFLRLWQK